MKTEKEIRAHRDDLLASLKRPCGCLNTGHALECLMGGQMVQASANVLSWVLGGEPDYDRLVEEFAARTARAATG
jgi:hypothetical protein